MIQFQMLYVAFSVYEYRSGKKKISHFSQVFYRKGVKCEIN